MSDRYQVGFWDPGRGGSARVMIAASFWAFALNLGGQMCIFNGSVTPFGWRGGRVCV